MQMFSQSNGSLTDSTDNVDIVNSFVARRLVFFCVCHDFCLKKHNPLFIFPLRLPC